MTKTLDRLRRDAKALRQAHEAGTPDARARIATYQPRPEGQALKHADYLHVIARENSFASWPALKEAVEIMGMDRAAKLQRLKIALHHGQVEVVERLLAEASDLADGSFGLEVALYNRDAVAATLAKNPSAATELRGMAPPLVHLAQSRMFRLWPEREGDMLAIARMLLDHGADVNRGAPAAQGSDHMLSPLYFAIGHADNMVLAEWLLDHGADPNDGESLYHSTELGHHEGLRLLLAAGADPKRTNALLRAMDFHDHAAVRMLLENGARADDFDESEVGGEAPWTMPALHQAARRMCDAEMVALLLEAGADPARVHQGASAYGYARVFGNRDLARAIEARSAATGLTHDEELLAMAAEGAVPEETWIDPAKLPDAYRNILREIVGLPGKLPHIRALVALGVEYDRPDGSGLTPVQIAGWEGLPEEMAYLLSLKPDLAHVNAYGGTLLSTIIHGSENCPARAERDHVACLRLALEHGVALPRRAIGFAADDAVAAFLADWAASYPGQVI